MASENASATVTREPKPGKKYFTVAEANRSLKYVARVVEDLTGCYNRVVELRRAVEQPEDQASRRERELAEGQYEKAMDALSGLVDELQHVGVELKDFEKGLIDFPAIHDGREIYLCWHRGEDAVHAWHELDAGYGGRQDIALIEKD